MIDKFYLHQVQKGDMEVVMYHSCISSWIEEFGKPKLKMVPGASSSCLEFFLELYSMKSPLFGTDILFVLSCWCLSEGWRVGVNEEVT